MTARMNNNDRWDFADHMANQTFEPKIEKARDELKMRGGVLMSILSTPAQREAAQLLPDRSISKGRDCEFVLRGDYFANSATNRYGPCRCDFEVTISMPEAIALPLASHRNGLERFSFNMEDLGKLYDQVPHWIEPSQVELLRREILPKLEAALTVSNEKFKFRDALYERLKQVPNLKRLKELSPDLHSKWVAYFSLHENAQLPAEQFDDLLQVMATAA